jgi:predicted MFS family arabinose efflux permease
VYGFSHAETAGWGDSLTIGFLVAAIVLLSAFVLVQTRVAHPLLPIRVVADRFRGASYLAVAISGAGMFGVFLFLTYYLQQTLGFTPIQTGLGFLPMVGCIMVTATTATAKLVPRFGPRPLVSAGMTLAAGGLVILSQVGVHSAYAFHVLPGLLIMGVGMGLIFAPAMQSATAGVDPHDAGVASAMVNTGQQIGGSVGTALLSTLSASAVNAFAAGKPASADLAARAAVHGYTTAFWWSAGIFLAGAVICGLVFPSGTPKLAAGIEPVAAH